MPKMNSDLTVTLIPQDKILHRYEYIPWLDRLEYSVVEFFEAGDMYIHDECGLYPRHYAVRKENIGKFDMYGLMYQEEKDDERALSVLMKSDAYCGGKVQVVDAVLLRELEEFVDEENDRYMELCREQILINEDCL